MRSRMDRFHIRQIFLPRLFLAGIFILALLPNEVGFASQDSQSSGQSSGQKSAQKSVQKILALISGQPNITIAELATRLGVSPGAVKKHLRKLKVRGFLKRVGPDKGGHCDVTPPNQASLNWLSEVLA